MRFVEKNILANSLVIEAQTLLNTSKHYNQNDRVRDIIRSLYSSCCAFCECSPEDGSFFQIEHFYPKNISKFKIYAKSIENLHYSCQRCNTLKGRKVHTNILSPNYYLNSNKWIETQSEKIENELYYIGHLLFSINTNPSSIDRGNETIKLFDLNNKNGSIRSSRQHLIESRLRVFDNSYNVLNVIYELLVNYEKKNNKAIELLFSIFLKNINRTSHYSIMIIHNFGSELMKLLSIYNKVKVL
jgi:uncharacterized protein (TIGR02646 family)